MFCKIAICSAAYMLCNIWMYPALLYLECIHTYSRPGIDVALGINVAPGTFGKIKSGSLNNDWFESFIYTQLKVLKNPKIINADPF